MNLLRYSCLIFYMLSGKTNCHYCTVNMIIRRIHPAKLTLLKQSIVPNIDFKEAAKCGGKKAVVNLIDDGFQISANVGQ